MRWCIVLGLVVATASAHAEPPTPTPARSPFCYLGRDTCDTILLTETDVGIGSIVGGQYSGHPVADLATELGLLVNTSHGGFGGSAGLHVISHDTSLALVVRGRYRHWLSNRTGLDLSLGYLEGAIDKGGRGATFQVAIERSDRIALFADVDLVAEHQVTGTEPVLQIAFGVRFAGGWSIPGALLSILILSGGRGNG